MAPVKTSMASKDPKAPKKRKIRTASRARTFDGGAGTSLPRVDFDQRAGTSGISGNAITLPKLKLNREGWPLAPQGTGKPFSPSTLEPDPCLSATRTGSLLAWGGIPMISEPKEYSRGNGTIKVLELPDKKERPPPKPLSFEAFKAMLEEQKELEDKEKAAATRESRLPRNWSSDPASFTPILKNTDRAENKQKEMIAPWAD